MEITKKTNFVIFFVFLALIWSDLSQIAIKCQSISLGNDFDTSFKASLDVYSSNGLLLTHDYYLVSNIELSGAGLLTELEFHACRPGYINIYFVRFKKCQSNEFLARNGSNCIDYLEEKQTGMTFSKPEFSYYPEFSEKIQANIGYNKHVFTKKLYIEKGYMLQLYQSYSDPESGLVSINYVNETNRQDYAWHETIYKLNLFKMITNKNATFVIKATFAMIHSNITDEETVGGAVPLAPFGRIFALTKTNTDQFLLANIEIQADSILTGYEVYSSYPGDIALMFKTFKFCKNQTNTSCAVYLNQNSVMSFLPTDVTEHTYDLITLTYGYNNFKVKNKKYVPKGSLLYMYQLKSSSGRVSIESNSSTGLSDFNYITSSTSKRKIGSGSRNKVELTRLDPSLNCRFLVRATVIPIVKPRKLLKQAENCSCLNGGVCQNGKCVCKATFTGRDCEKKLSVCEVFSKACMNKAACVESYDSSDSFSCMCHPAYTGLRCEYNLCGMSPCLNNGVCTYVYGSYHCACMANFTGANCEVSLASVDASFGSVIPTVNFQQRNLVILPEESFLLTNAEIKKDCIITALEVYAYQTGEINLDFLKFSTCSYAKTAVGCADYLLNSDSLGEYDFVRFQRKFINLNQLGFNYILLEEPVYAPQGTIMNLNQLPLNKGSGNIAMDISNSLGGKSDMILRRSAFGYQIRKLNTKMKWKFYLNALAKTVPAEKKLKTYGDTVPKNVTTSRAIEKLTGNFLLANVEILEDSFITGFEIYGLQPGAIEIWLLKFKKCGKSIRCSVFLQTLALGSLDNSPRDLRALNTDVQDAVSTNDYTIHSRTIIDLAEGFNTYKLDIPIFATTGTILFLKQLSSGVVGVDTSGLTYLSDLYLNTNSKDLGVNQIVKISSKTNWRFYVKALTYPLTN